MPVVVPWLISTSLVSANGNSTSWPPGIGVRPWDPAQPCPSSAPRYIAIFVDEPWNARANITDRVRAEQRLVATKEEAELANRAKSEFLTNMSHELRTPLNAIMGFAEVIRDQMMGSAPNLQYVDFASNIYASGKHLLGLINDILDISKIESGNIELEPEPVDVLPVVRSSLVMVTERAKEGGLELIVEIPDSDVPPLNADARRLKQVVVNLLSNAVKFTQPGGTVTVRVRYDTKR